MTISLLFVPLENITIQPQQVCEYQWYR